jgi:hypothetical protein
LWDKSAAWGFRGSGRGRDDDGVAAIEFDKCSMER